MTAVRPAPPGVVGGYAPLDSGLLIPRAYLPAVSAAGQGACPQLSGSVVDVLHGDGAWDTFNPVTKGLFYAVDFISAAAVQPWWAIAIASGGWGGQGADANHLGIVYFSSHATNPNSGYCFYLGQNCLLITGGEYTDVIFMVPTGSLTGVTTRLGMHDSISTSDPVDGCYANIIDGVLTGVCASNSNRTSSATTYSIVADVWYRLHIEVNAAATSVAYTLRTCTNGTVVWSDSVTTNIPTGAGRQTGHAVVSTYSGTGTKVLLYLDYMSIAVNRTLTR